MRTAAGRNCPNGPVRHHPPDQRPFRKDRSHQRIVPCNPNLAAQHGPIRARSKRTAAGVSRACTTSTGHDHSPPRTPREKHPRHGALHLGRAPRNEPHRRTEVHQRDLHHPARGHRRLRERRGINEKEDPRGSKGGRSVRIGFLRC